jgi:hypothetical protein
LPGRLSFCETGNRSAAGATAFIAHVSDTADKITLAAKKISLIAVFIPFLKKRLYQIL